MTISAIRVPSDSYMYVGEPLVKKHETVSPGMPIMEAMDEYGVPLIITAESWGVVEYVAPANTVLSGRQIIYDLVNEVTASVKGKTGLTMKPSSYVRWLKMGQPSL